MGEYWQAANVDKREKVDPFTLDEGLKLSEWCHMGSASMRRVHELIAGRWAGDEIRIVSDYGNTIHYAGPETSRRIDYDDDDLRDVSIPAPGGADR